jgi:hypothetical protein
MKVALFCLLVFACSASAALQPGDMFSPYLVTNTDSGKTYCQVCQYGALPAKMVAFGNFDDDAFWADLEKMQAWETVYGKKLGLFAHVLDSKDTVAIAAKARKHKITFPVVIPAEEDWDKSWKVNGVSRTLYYATMSGITWVGVGLSDETAAALEARIKEDVK